MTKAVKSSINHLDLVNAVIGLTYNLQSYPNHFYKTGYHIAMIEPSFKVNGELKPDLLLMAVERGLLVECKTGNMGTGKNTKNYSNIGMMDVATKGIDIPSEKLELDVAIFGKNNIDKLKDKLKSEGIEYPQVILDGYIEKVAGNSFKDPQLEEQFTTKQSIDGHCPLTLKFSDESTKKLIAAEVIKIFMSRCISGQKEFTSKELTKEMVGEIWDKLDSELQKTLNHKVSKVLAACWGNKEFKTYFKKTDGKYSIEVNDNWKSRRKFSIECNKFIKNLDQKTLLDF